VRSNIIVPSGGHGGSRLVENNLIDLFQGFSSERCKGENVSLVNKPKTKRAGIVLTIIGSAMLPAGVYISLFPLLLAIDSTPRSGNIWASGVIFFLLFSVLIGAAVAIPGLVQMITGLTLSLRKKVTTGPEGEALRVGILREKAISLAIVAASVLVSSSMIAKISEARILEQRDGGLLLLSLLLIALVAVSFAVYFAITSKDQTVMIVIIISSVVLLVFAFIQAQTAFKVIF
jgi:hypothetical protein